MQVASEQYLVLIGQTAEVSLLKRNLLLDLQGEQAQVLMRLFRVEALRLGTVHVEAHGQRRLRQSFRCLL